MPQPQHHRFFELIRPGTRFNRRPAARLVSARPGGGRAFAAGAAAQRAPARARPGPQLERRLSRRQRGRRRISPGQFPGRRSNPPSSMGATRGSRSWRSARRPASKSTRSRLSSDPYSPLAPQAAATLRATLDSHRGKGLSSFEWSEAGDRLSLRFDGPVEASRVEALFQEAGVKRISIQPVVMQRRPRRGRSRWRWSG